MTADAILARLAGELPIVVESHWLSLALAAVVAGGLTGAIVHFLKRKRIADLKRRLERCDQQLARAKADMERMEGELGSLQGERDAGQGSDALLASLREQLASAQRQLLAVPRATAPPSRNSSRQARFDELFGPGSVIDGRLTKGEAERLIRALRELADLMKSRLGSARGPGAVQPHSLMDVSMGSSWWLYVSQKGLPHAIELVAAFRADVVDFANSLEAAIARQADLEYRLRRIVGKTSLIANLLNMAGGFLRSMERLNDGENYKPPVLAMALGGPFQTMVQAQIALDEWMQLFVEQRAPAMHREAAAFLQESLRRP